MNGYATAAQSRPDVARQPAFSQLIDAADQTHAIVRELEERLGPILAPPGPDTPGPPVQDSSPLASEVRKLANANARLQVILRRIDL